jgi:3-hydroxyisobutyrate dehydrogenase-like beta-hydroxyacid dehydrogenase
MTKVGFIGLGAMGLPMATNLAARLQGAQSKPQHVGPHLNLSSLQANETHKRRKS